MKKILMCCYGLGIGGIERCMINLLNTIDTNQYEIDVLPMNPEFALISDLKAKVNILDPFDYCMNTTDTISEFNRKKASISKYIKYICFRIINKWGSKPWKLFNSPSKKYDIAIAYAHVGYVPYYVIDKISAKKKYMWHHEGRYIIDDRYAYDKEYFAKFDNIIAVSKGDQEILKYYFPEINNKIIVLYNIINKHEIIEKSKEMINFKKDNSILNITTVGRLTHQKGPDILIEVALKLKRDKIDFRWIWVGDGDLREFMENEIMSKELDRNVILLGNQINPYPYISICDIYVQPSYYEAYCTTTLEAQVLEKPIITTDVPGMTEQICNGKDGYITKIDAEEIYLKIKELYSNKKIREMFTINLQKKLKQKNNEILSYYELFNK